MFVAIAVNAEEIEWTKVKEMQFMDQVYCLASVVTIAETSENEMRRIQL